MQMRINGRCRVLCAAALAALMTLACGGGGGGGGGIVAPPASAPAAAQMKLTISATTDMPGSFGSVGAYEQLTGTISGEVDPKDPKNAVIQDLDLAPVNARGMVEYSADFVMLKPKDMSKASGVLRYDAPNRGNILTMPNLAANPSDAVFFERGYVWMFSAWQGDVPKSSPQRLTVTVPVAKNKDGSSITGPYATELLTSAAAPSLSLPGGVFNGTMIPYAPASLDNTQPGYLLTRRVNETDPRIAIPAADWKFASCNATDNPLPGTADPARICLKGGFQPNTLYELQYVAKDPKVMGVGLAALRDTIAFFRSQQADSAGTPNPIAGKIRHAIGQGTSQSGNAMKTFLHLGFNQRLDGGQVFEGIYAHVAARQTNINTRFAVPGGGGGLRTDHRAFGQTAPRGLAADYADAISGRTGGVMKRCTETATCPKFFLGLSGTEFWQLQGSPVLTDALGASDLVQPANARIYYYASTQHGSGTGSLATGINFSPTSAVYPIGSMTDHADTFRALFVDLEDWVVKNLAPPASQVPKLADGTLVRPDQLVFPTIAGATWPLAGGGAPTAIPAFNYLARYNGFPLLDYGPQYRPQDESGIPTVVPPSYMGKDYAILVPQVDPGTGLTKAGIRNVDVQAPLGTSLEFNYVATPGIVDLVNLSGSFIPFHKTEAARIAAGDTRPSIESLYGNQAGFVTAVTGAANSLVAQRFLLQRDADRRIARAQSTVVLP
ncbi:alpha/beta hydrolase domain-containing protein [Variovorax sp. LjRoot178]|uniref:alpha/beta hydrolase domain-containing protein n=1 Tax=Variovorax sp. LjRoot178 TaxID=3342277 RepID=UPI003ECF6704